MNKLVAALCLVFLTNCFLRVPRRHGDSNFERESRHNADSALVVNASGKDYDMSDEMKDYGVKLQYSKGARMTFPDFTIEFIGQRHVQHETYKAGFNFMEFEVFSAHNTQVVSWSSGTGDITGIRFNVADIWYELELFMSERLGRLADNELVLWKLDGE